MHARVREERGTESNTAEVSHVQGMWEHARTHVHRVWQGTKPENMKPLTSWVSASLGAPSTPSCCSMRLARHRLSWYTASARTRVGPM